MAQVSPANFKTLSPQHESGYSNGLFVEEATGGIVLLRDSAITNVFDPATHCRVFEDFLGITDIPTTGDTTVNVSSPWYIKDTSSGGSPTLAVSADYDCGAYSMAFSNTNEAQILTLCWNDEQNIDPTSHPIITYRIRFVSAIPGANDILVFGLGSAQNDTANSVASNAWFRLEGNSANLLVETDDGSTDTDDKDTSIDVAADTWYEFRVDAADYSDVKFYYRTTLSAAWTDITPSGQVFDIHATTGLQPYLQLQKSTGTGTTGILVDYVDVIWRRS